ncbi:YceI family protein [Solemya velesiana gill symbiont]|uniref:Lipid/polyisoprenoid-binding YceI-like domain-containing protein n=1 Tax=Solemya velesiana gill symbiont TaxID=1918948 RepID=A0A1T2KY89_9GAMM|nr:YceI family protein [Solemya velesiana gill symbiont]OOZ37771.1 hypothetical protein BOW51_00450 [Solemya velesiana gill symbiont]
MNIWKSFSKGIFFAVILLGFSTLGAENRPQLCAPFKQSNAVDPHLVSLMLEAAEDGELYLLQPSNFGFGVQTVTGRVEVEFTDFQGGISLNENEKSGQGPALVRIETGSLKTSGFLVRQMLKGDDFFDVDNYPEVFFVSKHLHWESPSKGILEGELTLRGVTRPVAFHVDLAKADTMEIDTADQIRMKATTTIQRSDFGMDAFPNLAEDKVDLSIQMVAARYANHI